MNAYDLLPALDRIGFAAAKLMAGALWQSTILFAATAIVVWALRRRRASLKHAVWAAALLAAPLVPFLTQGAVKLGTPRAEIAVMPVYREVLPQAAPVIVPSAPQVSLSDLPPAGEPLHATQPAPRPAPSVWRYPWAILSIAYLVGFATFVTWITIGQSRILSWKRRATAVAEERVRDAFARARGALGLSRDVPVLESAAIPCPFTAGAFYPAVLLPRDFASKLVEEDLDAVALHETAHVKRCDPLILSLVALVRAALFFHPLVWLAARRISLYAEQAADDAVLDAHLEPVSYARALTRIADGIHSRALTAEMAVGVVMSRSAFLTRVEAILSEKRDRIRKASRLVLAATAAAAVLSLAIALVVPLGDKPTGDSEKKVPTAVSDTGKKDASAASPTTDANNSGALKGQVVNPDGSPAANVKVTLVAADWIVVVKDGGEFFQKVEKGETTTDAKGVFSFADVPDKAAVVVMADAGFAAVTHDELAKDPRVTLARWGQVSGTLSAAGTPLAGRHVEMNAQGIGDKKMFFYTQWAETDDKGHFEFPRVVPGDYVLGDDVIDYSYDCQGHRGIESHTLAVDVAPGASLEVALGDTGRPIIGRLNLSQADVEKSAQMRLAVEITLDVPEPPVPASIQSRDAFAAWHDSKEWRDYWRAQSRYTTLVQGDGSFRVEGVPTGSYTLVATVLEMASEDKAFYEWRSPTERKLTVGEMSGGRSDEPLDLGTIDARLPGFIRGKVLNQGGKPVGSATVGLGRFTARTLPDGTFHHYEVDEDVRTVLVEAPGFQPLAQPIEPGKDYLDLELRLTGNGSGRAAMKAESTGSAAGVASTVEEALVPAGNPASEARSLTADLADPEKRIEALTRLLSLQGVLGRTVKVEDALLGEGTIQPWTQQLHTASGVFRKPPDYFRDERSGCVFVNVRATFAEPSGGGSLLLPSVLMFDAGGGFLRAFTNEEISQLRAFDDATRMITLSMYHPPFMRHYIDVYRVYRVSEGSQDLEMAVRADIGNVLQFGDWKKGVVTLEVLSTQERVLRNVFSFDAARGVYKGRAGNVTDFYQVLPPSRFEPATPADAGTLPTEELVDVFTRSTSTASSDTSRTTTSLMRLMFDLKMAEPVADRVADLMINGGEDVSTIAAGVLAAAKIKACDGRLEQVALDEGRYDPARATAILGLGEIGDDSQKKALVEIACSMGADNIEIRLAARRTLALLAGDKATVEADAAGGLMYNSRANAAGLEWWRRERLRMPQTVNGVTLRVADVARVFEAAEKGEPETATELLTATPALAEARNGDGRTPLMVAAANGHAQTTAAFAKAGSSMELGDEEKLYTALHWAAAGNHQQTADALLDLGADINARSGSNGYTPLHVAAEHGYPILVKHLIDRGAQVNLSDNYGNTPLLTAACWGHEETAKALLDAGADVSVVNSARQTASGCARIGGHEGLAKVLKEREEAVNRPARAVESTESLVSSLQSPVSQPMLSIISTDVDQDDLGSLRWRVASLGSRRLRNGIVEIVDGRCSGITSSSGSGGNESVDAVLAVALSDGKLSVKYGRDASPGQTSRGGASSSKALSVPDGSTLVAGYLSAPAILSTGEDVALWRGDFCREGKIVKTVVYAVRATTTEESDKSWNPFGLLGGPMLTSDAEIPGAALMKQAPRAASSIDGSQSRAVSYDPAAPLAQARPMAENQIGRFLSSGGPRADAAAMIRAAARQQGFDSTFSDATALGDMLETMAKEDSTFKEPADPALLSTDERVSYYVYKIRDIDIHEFTIPGSIRLFTLGDAPAPARALRDIGRPAVPALMALLENSRPTRSCSAAENGGHILRYSDVALQILEQIAGRQFDTRGGRGSYLSSADEETRSAILKRARAWWTSESRLVPIDAPKESAQRAR